MKKIIFTLLAIILLFEIYSFAFKIEKIKPIKYVERQSGKIKTEKVLANKALKWLYYDPFGKLSLETLIKRKFISEFYGKYMDSKKSVKKIEPFIRKLNLKETDISKYHSFNDFFTREIPDLKSHIVQDSNRIASPACGKVLAFSSVKQKEKFFIKGIRFSIADLIGKDIFKDATIFIIRLTPADYHRFYFPIDCKIISSYPIDGNLYSVSPIALMKNAKIFIQNKRYVTICENKKIGKFSMVEIGATFIGSIIQTYKGDFAKKGDEKGYFKFGGSSIVLIFPKNKVKIDEDILKNTQKGFETSIYAGESIGKVNVYPKGTIGLIPD